MGVENRPILGVFHFVPRNQQKQLNFCQLPAASFAASSRVISPSVVVMRLVRLRC